MPETISRDAVISFPMLGNLTLDPPASFSVFGRTIYFYGVLIGLGFLLGILFCARRARRFGLKEDDIYDVILWIIPCSIIGARVYYVLFNLDYYLRNPGEIPAVWNGGIAIYGGILAGAAATWLVCRRKELPLPAMLDCLCYGLLIGQILGRWGNFLNREAFGAQTAVFCRMGLTPPGGETVYVHPTFLYESLWNLGVLLFLLRFERNGGRRFDGHCVTLYLLLYGLGRFWIEGLRADSLYLGGTGIRVSQALSLVLALAAAALLLSMRRRPFSPGDLYVNRVAAAESAVILQPAPKGDSDT